MAPKSKAKSKAKPKDKPHDKPDSVPVEKPNEIPTSIPKEKQPDGTPKDKSKGKQKGNPPAKPKPKLWSMFPSRHDDVTALLLDSGLAFDFHDVEADDGFTREHDTNIRAFFPCRNVRCGAIGWVSAAAITIRMYAGQRYNARVYHQSCKQCDKLAKPRLDETYAERIANRLKLWSGMDIERPVFRKVPIDRPPHFSSRCEGCKINHCNLKNYVR